MQGVVILHKVEIESLDYSLDGSILVLEQKISVGELNLNRFQVFVIILCSWNGNIVVQHGVFLADRDQVVGRWTLKVWGRTNALASFFILYRLLKNDKDSIDRASKVFAMKAGRFCVPVFQPLDCLNQKRTFGFTNDLASVLAHAISIS